MTVQNPTQTVESYTYDAVGNRTASHQSSTYSYQPFNKVVTIGSTTYSYDSNGSLTSKVDGSGTWQYSWNYENRLQQVTRPDSTTINYKYDALGRRIQRSKSNEWTKYLYDGEDVVKDINSDGSVVEYLNGLGIDDKLRQTSSAGTLYFLSDHLNSTRALTDSSGNVVESINNDSFGNGASSLTRYGYTGREWDGEANLYYYRNRWYDPQEGRFISEDPIGFESGDINLYTYVRSNPVIWSDPTGLKVYICSRPANLPFPLNHIPHKWIKTDTKEAGLGPAGGGVPGQAGSDWPFKPTTINNHTGESQQPGATCEEVSNVDENAINKELEIGKYMGPWVPIFNDCWTFAYGVITAGRHEDNKNVPAYIYF